MTDDTVWFVIFGCIFVSVTTKARKRLQLLFEILIKCVLNDNMQMVRDCDRLVNLFQTRDHFDF